MEMISEAILGILHTSRRAVIPGLGAFLRKNGERQVVFVEFLKKDDGVLSGVLLEQYGLTAREAQEAVGAFVGDLQRMVATSEGFIIEGLGTMRIDANGVLDLQFDPDVRAIVLVEEPDEAGFVEEPLPDEPPLEADPDQDLVVEFDADDEAFEIVAAEEPEPQFEPDSGQAPEPADQPEQMVFELAPDPEPEPAPARRSERVFDELQHDDEPFDDADMRYNKPPKRVKTPLRKRADLIMIIAVAAATIAIAAMIFGTIVERRNRIPDPNPIEEIVPDSTLH